MNSPRNVAFSVMLAVLVLTAWEGLVSVFAVPSFILPTPSEIASALYNGIWSGLYAHHAAVTLSETLLGFCLAVVCSFVLGTFIALSRRLEYFLYPYIVVVQSIPKVAIAPLLLIWFGLGMPSKVVSAALVAFFPLLVNIIVGLRVVDEDRLGLMRSLSASQWQIFVKLRLPYALTYVMAGLEVAMIFALLGAIVGEFVGAQSGLGVLIQSMNANLDVSGVFAVLILLAVISLVLNKGLSLLRVKLLYWDPSVAGSREQRHSSLRI